MVKDPAFPPKASGMNGAQDLSVAVGLKEEDTCLNSTELCTQRLHSHGSQNSDKSISARSQPKIKEHINLMSSGEVDSSSLSPSPPPSPCGTLFRRLDRAEDPGIAEDIIIAFSSAGAKQAQKAQEPPYALAPLSTRISGGNIVISPYDSFCTRANRTDHPIMTGKMSDNPQKACPSGTYIDCTEEVSQCADTLYEETEDVDEELFAEKLAAAFSSDARAAFIEHESSGRGTTGTVTASQEVSPSPYEPLYRRSKWTGGEFSTHNFSEDEFRNSTILSMEGVVEGDDEQVPPPFATLYARRVVSPEVDPKFAKKMSHADTSSGNLSARDKETGRILDSEFADDTVLLQKLGEDPSMFCERVNQQCSGENPDSVVAVSMSDTDYPSSEEESDSFARLHLASCSRVVSMIVSRPNWKVHAGLCFVMILIVTGGSIFAAKAIGGGPRKSSQLESGDTWASDIDLHQVMLQMQYSLSQKYGGGSSFLDPSSPQSRALDWLILEKQYDGNWWQSREGSRVFAEPDSPEMMQFIQRYALAVFAFTCGIEDWVFVLTPWTEAADLHECDWEDVFCDEGGVVTSIELIRAGLSGTIPEELGYMTNIDNLKFDSNRLVGTIPQSFYGLTDLTTLQLGENKMAQSIESIKFESWQKMDQFVMEVNLITGTLSTSITSMPNLRVLGLSRTQVGGPVFELMLQMPSLEAILVDNTLVSGTIPTEIGLLSNLTYTLFGSPYINGTIPSELGMLDNLGAFFVKGYGGGITGTLPSEIGEMSGLVALILDSNLITGNIPTEVGNLGNLQTMDFQDNLLTGTLPSEIGRLTELQKLIVQSNRLTGSIPEEIGILPDLDLFETSFVFNDFEGELPHGFCNLFVTIEYPCPVTCDCCYVDCIGVVRE